MSPDVYVLLAACQKIWLPAVDALLIVPRAVDIGTSIEVLAAS